MSLDEKDESSAYKTTKGSFYLMMRVLAIGLSGSVLFTFVARFLPTLSDLGLYNGIQALINISVIVAGLGLPAAATRFISSYIGSGEKEMAKSIYLLIFRIGLISSAVVASVLYLLADHIATLFFHSILYVHLIHLASIDVFIYSMITFSIYLLYASQEFRKVALISIINSLLRFAIAFLLLLLGMKVDGLVIGLIIGDVVSLVLYIYALKSKIRLGVIAHKVKPLLKFSLPLYGSIIMNVLAQSIDNYLVLILAGLFVAGIYAPGLLIGTLLAMMLSVVGESLLPYFSRIYGKSGLKSLSDSAKPASRYIFLIYMPFGIATLACAPQLIVGVFGERYTGSIYPAMVIILAITVTSSGMVFNFIQISAGHTHVFLKSTALGVTVQIAIGIVTIPYAGALGAAFAKFSSFIVMYFYNTYKLKKMIGLNYDRDALQKGIIGSIIMASIIYSLNFYLHPIFYLPLSLVAGFSSYLLFLRYSHALNSIDIEMISTILPGKLNWLTRIIAKVVIE